MSKNLKTILIIVGVIVLFVLIFFLSEALKPNYFKTITYDEYKELIKNKDVNVYIGSKDDSYNDLEDIAKDNNIEFYYLDIKDVKNEKTGLVGYQDGKESFTITDFSNYKYKKELIDNGIISNQLLEVTISEYFEIKKENEYNFIFIGSSSCGYCTKFKPELATVAASNDVNLYYIDLASAKEEDLNKLYASDTYFTTEEWGTPLNFLMKNNERVAVLNGYNTASAVVEFFKTNKVL